MAETLLLRLLSSPSWECTRGFVFCVSGYFVIQGMINHMSFDGSA
jgi:hypothetical protein